jgi:chromosome segregation ATPase
MQSKSTRGVQQDDVWAAADALIAEGLRPTIERVRQKIGRGSPNTVSPMLEAWFATLGPRLGVSGVKETANDVPTPVQQAAVKLWETALVCARKDAAQSLEQAQETLTEARTAVELQKDELSQQAKLLAAREAAANEALQVARLQITEIAARLNESQAHLGRRDAEIAELRAALTDLGKQRDADRHRSDDALKRYSDERQRQEERAIANERRLMEELDRERQGNKQARIALAASELRVESNRQSAEGVKVGLSKKLQEMELELRSVRQSLTSENERSSELRTLLENQRAATGTALDQLNQFLADSARAADIVPAKRKRAKAKGGRETRTDTPQ